MAWCFLGKQLTSCNIKRYLVFTGEATDLVLLSGVGVVVELWVL